MSTMYRDHEAWVRIKQAIEGHVTHAAYFRFDGTRPSIEPIEGHLRVIGGLRWAEASALILRAYERK